MIAPDFKNRYDSFQKDAVNAIEKDFARKPSGRFLLVIPTGGGKTFAAAKSVLRLFETGVLNAQADHVVWVAHRTELLDQARDAFELLCQANPHQSAYLGNIKFSMISTLARDLSADSAIRLVVIDEAHHGAASSYQPAFARTDTGILGLTATPSRHDGQPLDFERESYSIGFPDLIRRGVVLKPEVRTIPGGTYNISSLDDPDQLEQLNNQWRNERIINELSDHKDEYKKVIIYVGTKTHAKSLYEALLSSPLGSSYQSISYITGDGNSRNQERKDYIAAEKGFERSIVVNVHVLSEGYDDPKVNTVMMAAPTRSKLYYMQAIGRALRQDPNDSLKKAIIVEVIDQLPNIRYRIDNRWLFADISDTLEPCVVDHDFSSVAELRELILRLYSEYSVPEEYRDIPELSLENRYSLLLFKVYRGPGLYAHIPLLISNDNRLAVSNTFNYLSERMRKFKDTHVNSEAAFSMLGQDGFSVIPKEADRKLVYAAMENAVPTDEPADVPGFVAQGAPWITFTALNYRQQDVPDEILAFTEGMVNREDILELIRTRSYEPECFLIRLPLPLASYVGRIVTGEEMSQIDTIVESLHQVKLASGQHDHRKEVQGVLDSSILPIELSHARSLVTIVREEETEYKLAL